MARNLERQWTRCRIKHSVAIYAFLCWMASYTFAEEKLYVFYPTTARPQTVQETLQEFFSGISVTVFGRYNDFSEKMATDPPDAVITKPVFIEQHGDYSITLSGIRNGKSEETYVLLSIKDAIAPKAVNAEMVIGVIDVLGKAGMESFVNNLLSARPRLKRVTKVEDLLPLLTFNMAAGILIEDVFVKYFKTTSHLEFGITPISGSKGGIIALGLKKGAKADKTVGALKKADKKICALFEVDVWR